MYLYFLNLTLVGANIVAYCDNLPFTTIRHSDCQVLLSKDWDSDCCPACSGYQSCLRAMASREERKRPLDDRTNPSSHTRYDFLSSSEMKERMHRLHSLQRCTMKQVTRLKAKLMQATETDGVEVDDALHEDLNQIVRNQSLSIEIGMFMCI